jgi:hypothetical protein
MIHNSPRVLVVFLGLIGLAAPLFYGACAASEAPPAQSPKQAKDTPAEAEDPAPKAEVNRCSRSLRNGKYKVQLQGISSNCQRVDDFEEELKDGVAQLGENCTHDKPDKWSEDGCKIERTYSCKEANGTTTRTTMVTSPESDDGSILAGIISIRKLDKSGSERCQGTFRFIEAK